MKSREFEVILKNPVDVFLQPLDRIARTNTEHFLERFIQELIRFLVLKAIALIFDLPMRKKKALLKYLLL